MRFPLFRDNWTKYRVSDLLETYPTNSLSWDQLSYDISELKNIHYGLIHNGFETTCIDVKSDLIAYIKPAYYPKKYTLLKIGDLILADASEDREDVGKSIEIIEEVKQKTISGLHTIHARDKVNFIIKGFKGFYFKSKPMKEQIFKIANGSKIYGITSSNFNELYMCIPGKLEQEKIVSLMMKIEQRIQTQSKIIEDYSLLKEHIIDFTFKLQDLSLTSYSFNDIFKERKEYHMKDENIIHATLSKEGLFPKTDRYDRDFLVKDLDKKYKISYLNDIVYNPANLKFGVITRNNYGTCIISPIYITYEVNKDVDSRFIELFVTRKKFLNEIRRYEQGTVYERMAVNSEDFLSYEAKLPSLKIQREIVSKIEFINKKINQENVYLDLLKKQKQYLLSNMFI